MNQPQRRGECGAGWAERLWSGDNLVADLNPPAQQHIPPLASGRLCAVVQACGMGVPPISQEPGRSGGHRGADAACVWGLMGGTPMPRPKRGGMVETLDFRW